MSEIPSYLIEVDEEMVGIAMPNQDHVIFHATHPAVQRLHGRSFSDTTTLLRQAAAELRNAA